MQEQLMDPDKALDELVELGYQLADARDEQHAQELLAEIIQKVTELREWISRGGFIPTPREETNMHDVENMFSVRSVPWHGLGSVLPEHPKSVEEILTAAGLNWEVGEFPVQVTLPSG